MKFLFNARKERDELKESVSDLREYCNCMQSQIDSLKTEVFNINYPNGRIFIERCYTLDRNGVYIYFKYTSNGKIMEVTLDKFEEDDFFLNSYKIFILNDYIHIGLRIFDYCNIFEKYYIVDIKKGNVMDIKIQDLPMESLDWTPFEKE